MKKFSFRLQKLLDMRQARENEIKNELMKILGIQNRERVMQEELRGKIRVLESSYREKLSKGVFSSYEAMALMRFSDISRRAIDEAEKRIIKLEPEVQRIREKLVQASREKKIVEKLKEKQYEEFMYEFNREIAKENDDMNQKIYQKRLTGGDFDDRRNV